MASFGGGTKVAAAVSVAGGVVYSCPSASYAIVQVVGSGTGTLLIDGQTVWSGTMPTNPCQAFYVGPGQTAEISPASGTALRGVQFSNV